MGLTALLALVRKDLQLFFSDRRSVIVSFVVPIAIASFFGSIFSGPSRGAEPAKIDVIVVDLDESPISTSIVEGIGADRNLKLTRVATVGGGKATLESVFLTLTGRSLRD